VASTPTTPVDVDKQAVLAAYQGYFRAILAANDPPNQFDPGLRRYATGAAFKSVFRAAQANRLAGHALRLPARSKTAHRATVLSIESEDATVRDCNVDDGLVVNLADGQVLNDDVTTRLVTASLKRTEGAWKVARTTVDQSWQGVAGCAGE